MNPFYRPQITDELLSAYLDGAVTNEEKTQIERAVQQDATIAWRLESLRQTVNLLRSLPEYPLPRSFVLTEADVAPYNKTVPPFVTTARRIQPPLRPAPERRGVGDSLREFLQGGSPLLRNLATTGLAIWLVLFGVTQINPMRTVVVQSPIETVGTNREAAAVAEALPTTPDQATLTLNESDDSSARSSLQTEAAPTETATAFTYSAPAAADAENPVSAASQEQPMTDAAPSANAPQEQSLQAMGGAQNPFEAARTGENPAAQTAPLPPGEDSSPLDQAMGDSGGASIAAAEIRPSAVDSTPVNSEEASSKLVAPAADQPVDGTDSVEEQEANLAVENTPQPTPEQQANVAGEAAAQPTQISEPTPTAEVPAPTVATEMYTQEEPGTTTPPEIAMAKQPEAANAGTQTTQRTTESVEEVTSMPLFDPVRVQLAQLLVALVTGILALFWLGSHMARRG